MNTRSIHFRLILWYSGLIALVSLALGAYTYHGVEVRLYAEMQQTLTRRAQQIADNILAKTPPESPQEIAAHIRALYSPEANNRFIRILRGDHSVLYVSGRPKDGMFDPSRLPLPADAHLQATRLEPLASRSRLFIVVVPVTALGHDYLIEMGTPTDGPDVALHGLIVTLLFGLPMAVLAVSAGGFLLMRRALKPVEDIRATAEQITRGNLSHRLPVSPSGDALEHLSVTLNRMLDRLEDAYEQATRFSADASHELRTPLTIMRGELESIIREAGVPAPLRERIGSVLEETERLSRITESLFAISRLDAGEAKIQHQKFDLAALAQGTAEQMLLLAEEKQIRLSIQAQQPVFIDGDAARIKQIVVNLLDNAIKYAPGGGAVWLKVSAAQQMAILEVGDNGAGIPAEVLPHVFERFFRADKARSRDFAGAGLGLAIVRSICLAHGGSVDIRSGGEGKGTVCRVELPLANGQEQKS